MIYIRPYLFTDRRAIIQVIDKVCRSSPWMTGRYMPTSAWEHALEVSDCRKHLLLLAENEGEIIGWCRLFPGECRQTVRETELGIGLLAGYRSRQIGTRLVKAALDWARPSFERVTLQVMPGNTVARHLFEHQGFIESGSHGSLLSMSCNLRPSSIALRQRRECCDYPG